MKLIDKDAVVSEIDDWRDKIMKGICIIPLRGRQRADATLECEVLKKVREFLDTLEVKEMDLEKEAERFVQTKEFIESTESPVILVAKHFFELGLKAQKGE